MLRNQHSFLTGLHTTKLSLLNVRNSDGISVVGIITTDISVRCQYRNMNFRINDLIEGARL